MIKALMLFLRCAIRTENEVNYSFGISRYNDENEIYLDIKSVDINVGVSKYSTKNIMSACNSHFASDTKTRDFLEYFLRKFLAKNKIKDGTVYIELEGRVIRIRNKSINEQSVLRISISK